MASDLVDRLKDDPQYRELVRRQGRMSFWLSSIIIAVNGIFIVTLITGGDLFATRVIPNTEFRFGMFAALGIMVLTVILTGLYVRRSNRILEPLRKRLIDAAS